MSLAIAGGVGLAAGVLGGLLGVGGGVIMVPGMVLLLQASQHTAQGVSLAVMVVLALVGAATHRRQGNVRLRVALLIAPSAVISGLLGGYLAGLVEASLLVRLFGLFVLVVGAMMALGR